MWNNLAIMQMQVLAQRRYDSAIIHVGINDLLNALSIKQISKDVVEIAQRCRNGSDSKVFVSGFIYCTKVRYEKIQNLNEGSYGNVWSIASVLLIMERFRRKIYERME